MFWEHSTPWTNAMYEDLEGASEVMAEKKISSGPDTRDERSSRKDIQVLNGLMNRKPLSQQKLKKITGHP